jgi:adenosylcobyric acid synthase
MHMGVTTGAGCANPMLDLQGRADGAVSPDGRVMGCYVHGLFAADEFRRAFLARLGHRGAGGFGHEARVEEVLDRLAEHLEVHMDVGRCLEIAADYSARPAARSTASAVPARR